MIESAAPPRRDLQLIRLYFFVSIGAGGFLIPFLSLFFRRQGLSGTEIGLLGTVQALVGLISAPIAGNMSDRLNRTRSLIQMLLLTTAVMGLLIGRQDQFIIFVVLVAFNALFSAGLAPMSEGLANTVASRYEDVGFGSIRLWGSLGWTLVTAVAGGFIERLGLYFGFIAQAVGLALSAVVLQFMPDQEREKDADGETGARLTMRQGLQAIRRNQRLINLALALGFVWLLSSGLYQFEAIYLDELGAGETTIGLANSLNALVELPAMLWADRMLKRLSPGWLLRAGFLIQALRMAAILAFPTIPMIVAMRPFMGVQYSLYAVGVIGYMSTYADRSYRVTALALITVTLRNLAEMIGSPLSGLVFDIAGGYWLYALSLVGASGGWLILQMGKSRAQLAQLGS